MGYVLYAQDSDWLISEQNCPGFCGRVLNKTAVNENNNFSSFVSALSKCQVYF